MCWHLIAGFLAKFLAKWLLKGDSEENKKVRITANLLAIGLVGLGGLEPPTASLSVQRSVCFPGKRL